MYQNQVGFILAMQRWLNIKKSRYVIYYITIFMEKWRKKCYIIISTEAKNSFDKILHPFTIKIIRKPRINSLYLIDDIIKNLQ